jgi:hypothetical protein
MVDEERVAGSGLDGDGDAVAVVGSEREDAEDQQVERSLEEGISGRGVVFG